MMSVLLDFDESALASRPLGPGERESHIQIELACRFYAYRWLAIGTITQSLPDAPNRNPSAANRNQRTTIQSPIILSRIHAVETQVVAPWIFAQGEE